MPADADERSDDRPLQRERRPRAVTPEAVAYLLIAAWAVTVALLLLAATGGVGGWLVRVAAGWSLVTLALGAAGTARGVRSRRRHVRLVTDEWLPRAIFDRMVGAAEPGTVPLRIQAYGLAMELLARAVTEPGTDGERALCAALVHDPRRVVTAASTAATRLSQPVVYPPAAPPGARGSGREP